MPPDHLLPDRLVAVLAVVYLIFNEGYGGRGELAAEALRLGGALAGLMPDEPEVHGLLAMMLLLDARREARFRGGDLVLLGYQDRSLWDHGADRRWARGARAGACSAWPRPLRHAGRDRLPACRRAADWEEIAALYGELARLTDSPVVELNRAIAVAEEQGPEAGLRILERLGLEDYRYLHSTRGELLRRLGRNAEARAAYRRALELVPTTLSAACSSGGWWISRGRASAQACRSVPDWAPRRSSPRLWSAGTYRPGRESHQGNVCAGPTSGAHAQPQRTTHCPCCRPRPPGTRSQCGDAVAAHVSRLRLAPGLRLGVGVLLGAASP